MMKFLAAAALVILPAVAVAEGGTTAAAEDKVKCKKVAETGSMARFQKICRTEKEWRRIKEQQRKEAGDLTTPTGGARSSG
jgi:hypothetical protein